jgi:anthraniloyl-CoA monooxygenase
MSALRVAVLGGGPAGLTAAQVLKRRHPGWDVTVFERQTPESTFGYGVGLGWGALKALAVVAPDLVTDLKAVSVGVDRWTVRRGDESITATNSHGIAIARELLLMTLREHAEKAGVLIRTGVQTELADVADADLVLVADGVGSLTRAALSNELGVTSDPGELAFLWCGAEIARTEMTLALGRTAAGPMAAHVMPYSGTSSTFQVDAMQDTIRALSEACTDPDGADASLAFLENLYADLLGTTKLCAKRPSWQTFTTVACERWHHGSAVLLGDAAHTAHYTVGSGTGLAIEDAVCLATALDGEASLQAAFEAYAAERQPRVRRLQERAARSQLWWSSLGLRIDEPLHQVLLSYLTRTGAVPLTALAEANPDLLRQFLPGVPLDANLADAVLAIPFEGSAGRVVPTPEGDDITTVEVPVSPTLASLRATVEHVRDLTTRGVHTARLTGPAGADAVLDRLDVAESLRAGAKVTTVVVAPHHDRDVLAVGVLTGRTDLVEVN